MTDYVQARPSTGYLIHAVPEQNKRSGLMDQYIGGKPLCARITGRDSWGLPSMVVLYDGERNALPFTVESATEKTCVRCKNKLARQIRKEAA